MQPDSAAVLIVLLERLAYVERVHVPSPRVLVLTLLLAGAGVVTLVVVSTGGGAPPKPPGELVSVVRGDVSETVGGIGHVTTLAGAARLAVPVSAPAGTSSPSTSSGKEGGAAGGSREAPADAVFPTVTGHVTELLVTQGQKVLAGQPVARLADDGTIATATVQARAELAAARLELAQRRVHDPGRGLPPTSAELSSARQGVLASRAKLRAVLGGSSAAEVDAARADLAKAEAELASSSRTGPAAIEAAQASVAAAQAKLAAVSGSPDPAEVAAAQLDVAKATVEQESLLGSSEPPTAAARTAAQLAVDAARAKLEALMRPSAPVVYSAREELAKAKADLETQRAANATSAVNAERAAIRAARRKLAQLRAAPARDVVATARADLRKAQADFAILRQRGAPASSVDIALARLKVDVASQRLALEQQLASGLVVRANSTGTVTSLFTVSGASADPTTPLVRVQDLEHLAVTVDLSEYDVARVRIGAPAVIGIEALGDRSVGGTVSDVALSGSENSGVVNFPVTIALHSSSGPRPGMSVKVRIIVERARNVLRVPAAAIHEGDQPTVLVSGPGARLVSRHVELGVTGTGYDEVTSGLRAGEKVFVPSAASGGE
jgi:multidrug efflux pump subunit AcrA (membrane-fusion protein)